jgi:glutamine amidotransferase
MANRRDSLEDVLYQERAPAHADTGISEDDGSWGLGFYQSGEVLYKKQPLAAGEALDWQEASAAIVSDCVIGHLRRPTVGPYRSENSHPFRMRSWLFAHQGVIRPLASVHGPTRDEVRSTLPDFIRRNMRGQTDSELFFHLILSFLHDEGQLDNPDAPAEVVVQAIRSSVALVRRYAQQSESSPVAQLGGLNLMLTDGKRLFAHRLGHPMGYVSLEGLHDPFTRRSRPVPEEGTLRCALLLGSVHELPERYTPLDDGEVITVSHDLSIHHHAA